MPQRTISGVKVILLLATCLVFFQNCASNKNADTEAHSPASGLGCPALTITTLKNAGGGRLDWHPSGNSLAFDKISHVDSVSLLPCVDVFTMDADGSNEQCLTCGHADLPTVQKGQPAWHPNGRHLMFQAEKESHLGARCGIAANPGAGIYNDIWVLDTQANDGYPIYQVNNGQDYGVLHPHFSHDGTKLLWAEAYSRSNIFIPGLEAGKWKVMIADVSIDGSGIMSLSNITQLLPKAGGAEGFFETHGFNLAGTRIQYSSNAGIGVNVGYKSDIFTADLNGNNAVQVTSSHYNEHAFVSNTGNKIVFMSDLWANNEASSYIVDGTEFYIAHSDGSNVCRLTHFNESGFPESQANTTIAADISWHPSGTKFAGYSHANGAPQIIWVVDFGSVQ